jgi:hypothetical protein
VVGDAEFVWLGRIPNPLRYPLRAGGWILQLMIGAVTLLVLLTVAAAIPLLNLIALGYLLEVEGRVAHRGRLSEALPLLPAVMRIGSVLVGIALCLIPLMLLADFTADAYYIAPQGTATRLWIATLIAVAMLAAVHITLALACGGKPACFLRPIRNIRWLREQLRAGDYGSPAHRALRSFFAALRPAHLFWLGVRGFFGSWVWLALPTALYGARWYADASWSRPIMLAGGACLLPVLAWVPFLQVRLAVENRWSAMFEVRDVRELFRHAPLAWAVATAGLYALSVPLFLYSVQFRMHAPFPLEFWWDLALISIACTFPARVALGWVYHCATVRGPAWIGWIWFSRLLIVGSLALYVWLLYHTPLTHESRPWQLEHHALVLPIPFS